MTPTCPLCDRLHRLHASPDDDVVWQFPHSVALLGPWQYYTGYCILVARTHVTELHRMPRDDRRAFMEELMRLSEAIDRCFQPRKLNCESLGNQVPHVHWHLFPRRHDDPEAFKPVWLALDRAETDSAEKQRLQGAAMPRPEIARRLREQLQQIL